jgi:predicted RNase H-like nuclease (RuvC/YqgF family)
MAAYLLAALVIGFMTGWLMRRSTANSDHAAMHRQLVEIKSRIPQLETAVRHREQQVARLKEEIDLTAGKIDSLTHSLQERERTIGDRDRTVSLLRSEIALLKQSTPSDVDYEAPTRDERKVQELEERLRERDAQIAEFARRLADAVARPGGETSPETVKRLRELEEAVAARTRELRVATDALTDRDKRIVDLDRERERQDKWMGVLTEQLETLRETNRRLNDEATEAKSARERIRHLESEVARLVAELGERDRRLAASRFELSTARAMVADLQGRVGSAAR